MDFYSRQSQAAVAKQPVLGVSYDDYVLDAVTTPQISSQTSSYRSANLGDMS